MSKRSNPKSPLLHSDIRSGRSGPQEGHSDSEDEMPLRQSASISNENLRENKKIGTTVAVSFYKLTSTIYLGICESKAAYIRSNINICGCWRLVHNIWFVGRLGKRPALFPSGHQTGSKRRALSPPPQKWESRELPWKLAAGQLKL